MCNCGSYYCADDNQHYANCEFECEYYTTPEAQASVTSVIDLSDTECDDLPF